MHHASPRRSIRGAATLALAATLLLLSSLVALYSQQRLWFEQQASSNQIRAIEAAEMAQAGLEWAIAQLNTPNLLSTAPSCEPASAAAGQQFRERYAEPRAATAIAPSTVTPAPTAQAGCNILGDGTLHCVCPAPGQPPAWASPQARRFMVEFLSHPDDPLAIEVRSTGHSEGLDASAQVRQVLKLAPALVHPPDAAVMVGGQMQSAGVLRIVNQDVVNQGMGLRAGGIVAIDPQAEDPASQAIAPSAVVANDPVLKGLQAADVTGERFFETLIRRSVADFRNDPLTTIIDASRCATPGDCGALLLASHQRGSQQFWLDVTAALDTSQLPGPILLGTQTRPVLIASAKPFSVAGHVQLRGLLLVDELRVNQTSADDTTITGALVVRGDLFHAAGALSVAFDRTAMGMAGGVPTGLLTPVPGTWRDRFAAY